MQNYKEFRCGNLIEYDGRYFEIDTIHEIFPTLNTEEFGIGVVDWNNIKPIPLDENILLKFGDAEIKFFCKGVIVLERFLFLWKEEYKYWYVLTFENQVYLTKIEYLHEYQNFIFSLTGKELEVSL